MRVFLLSGGFIAAALGLGTACGEGHVQANSGLTEPLQVAGGQFFSGALPGTAADEDAGDAGASTTAPLTVTSVTYQNELVVPGASGKSFGGLVTQDALAVGVRFADLGTGYWVVPVQGIDSNFPGQRDFSFGASFNPGDQPGLRQLLFVALDGSGNGGVQYEQPICIESRVPDNGHACDPSSAVPAAVFTLRWDTNFDIDLHVVTPEGQDINPKTDLVVGDGGVLSNKVAHIDRDSIGNCLVDSWHEEDLIFPQYPQTGYYDVYVDPFSSCGQPDAHFTFLIYEAQSDGNLHQTFSQSGVLLASQANAGQSTGLFVAEKVFE
jgi:hypothetical protein